MGMDIKIIVFVITDHTKKKFTSLHTGVNNNMI